MNGDLNGDDIVSGSFTDLEITGNIENVYHVLLVFDASTSIIPVTIDGFTIRGGNANNTLSYMVNGMSITMKEGGAIFIQNQPVIITNCFIVNNSALYGGGISSFADNTVVNNNIIASNIALTHGGGVKIYFTLNNITNNGLSET